MWMVPLIPITKYASIKAIFTTQSVRLSMEKEAWLLLSLYGSYGCTSSRMNAYGGLLIWTKDFTTMDHIHAREAPRYLHELYFFQPWPTLSLLRKTNCGHGEQHPMKSVIHIQPGVQGVLSCAGYMSWIAYNGKSVSKGVFLAWYHSSMSISSIYHTKAISCIGHHLFFTHRYPTAHLYRML